MGSNEKKLLLAVNTEKEDPVFEINGKGRFLKGGDAFNVMCGTLKDGSAPNWHAKIRSKYKSMVKQWVKAQTVPLDVIREWRRKCYEARRLASVCHDRDPEYTTAMITSCLLLFAFFVFILRRFTAKRRKL